MKMIAKIWNGFWDWFGDIGFLFFVFGFLFVALAVLFQGVTDEREKMKLANKLCYSRGMVVVDTEAGQACVAQSNLVMLK